MHLSLQYHSQAELIVRVDGEEVARLTPSLVGMYLTGHGQSAYWPAGTFTHESGQPVVVEVEALAPSGIGASLGAPANVWLGRIAATGFDALTYTNGGAAADRNCGGGYVDRVVLNQDRQDQ